MKAVLNEIRGVGSSSAGGMPPALGHAAPMYGHAVPPQMQMPLQMYGHVAPPHQVPLPASPATQSKRTTLPLHSCPHPLPVASPAYGHAERLVARQTVGGTCGTVALLNALLNAPGVALPELGLEGDRPSAAAVLASPAVRAAHDRCAGAAGSAEAGRRQGRHFVALVKVAKDYLWLDGKRAGPVGAGPRSKKGAKRELRKLVDAVLDARPDALFSVVALVDTAPRPRPRPRPRSRGLGGSLK